MADQNQTPALPSTADTTPYVPVSWMAVSAALVSGSFLIVLIGLALWDFFKEKKPLLLNVLLIFPAIGIVLCYAARRMIRNSEGTRTGEKLVNYAWWGCIIGGLGFGAYLMAIDMSVRRDAESEAEKWLGHIAKDDPNDPKHVELNRAFIATLDPERRRNILADNPDQLESEFRDPYLAFKTCDLVRMVERNRGDCSFVSSNVKDWTDRPYGIDCIFTGTLKCREGTFPFQIPMRGVEGGANSQSAARRQWLLALPQTGFFTQERATRTPYGWMMEALDQSSVAFGKELFIRMVSGSIASYQEIYQHLIGPESNLPFWNSVTLSTPGRVALCGGPAILAPYFTADASKYFREEFFKLPGGGEPTQEQKSQFTKAWDLVGLVPPGARLKSNPIKSAIITITDNAIEARLPCELPLSGSDISAAYCRLVVRCTDPATVAEVKRLRDEPRADQESALPPSDLRTRIFKWQIVRVETDLRAITFVAPQRPGMPPSPQMPGGQ